MSTATDLTHAPWQRATSWFSFRKHFVSAPELSGGARTEADRPARILIVEDDLLIASEMEAALTDAGFEVAGIVTTGKGAVETARTQAPDLAVVDIKLAGDRNGVDTALELFRAHGIRCIFASAYLDREVHRRAEPAAPLGWLQKPYTMASLTEVVRAALGQIRGRTRK
jgi:DNA-binding NarL/FixJ family response regulator